MNKKIPMRQCISCGEMKAKNSMLRILKTPENAIVLDATGKQNGRGAYICKDRNCLLKVKKAKGLERAFKMNIPDEVFSHLEKEFDELDGK